jgi:hypothetical protein
MSKSYPEPRHDADNAEFLAGWRRGILVIQRCSACGRAIFYPRPLCPNCWSDRLECREASGRGRIVAFSLVHRPNDAAFDDETPIALAEVRLEEGAALLARIVGSPPEKIRSGLDVRLPPAAISARYPLPVFQLATDD